MSETGATPTTTTAVTDPRQRAREVLEHLIRWADEVTADVCDEGGTCCEYLLDLLCKELTGLAYDLDWL
ncbi:MAG: hypothetical protein HYR62_08925 [Actinobacteria bacterium]|nr:hypothetical protein [Actinomycetota bacterium]MBI3688565.1 hypothetical protein [Actinomycetota bacterium]